MVPRVRRLIHKSRELNRGKCCQTRIAEALDELRKFGYCVFDDLKRDGYHLDHVIVGPTGVFAIETKFGNDVVNAASDQHELRGANANSLAEESIGKKDSRKSAHNNAIKVDQIIKGDCEFDGWIWPLVVIAGEWRVQNDPSTAEARLFTKETLVRHIVDQPTRLTSTEINLIASHLERSTKMVVKLRKKGLKNRA